VQYTVWSGSRQIGVTDLGFRYREHGMRTGWFYPTAIGEPLMPEIVDLLIGDDVRFGRSDPIEPVEALGCDESEDACEDVAAWDLRVRREDGSLVPTESVGIRDVGAYFARPPNRETWEDELDEIFDFDDDPSEGWKRAGEDERTAELRRAIEHDRKIIEEVMAEMPQEDEPGPDQDEALPRYQIFVLLSDPSAVP
jgi:hypothetical protein